MKELAPAIFKAIQRRQKLAIATNAMRLINGAGDGLEGLLIDRYHKHVHAQFLSEHWHEHKEEISRILATCFPLEYLIIKSRRGLGIKTEVLIGSDPCTVVCEHGITFEVNLNDGLNCGLFLDMRRNRWMVAEASQQAKVLNCFSYTCSFGLYARAAGARQVINTDISRKILGRGKRNYQLNGITASPDEFVQVDSLFYLQRALKKGNHFDVIILDPPSFARNKGKVFQIKRDLPSMMEMAVAILNPKGRLMVSTNYSEISHADLENMLARALKGRRLFKVERIGQDEDFRASNSFKESYLAGLWAKFL